MSATALVDLSIHEFLERLAGDQPTPGGGAVAALAGALAAGLGEMACAYTVGRPKFAAVEAAVRAAAERLSRARAMFRALIDDDAAAYGALSDALKRPKSDPERATQLAQAAELAAGVPLQTAALAVRTIEELGALRPRANPLLVSDVDAATHLATAALRAAAANVRVNLSLMAPDRAALVERELAALERRG